MGEFQIGRKYRFKITDMYGWDISKSQSRDIKLGSLLDDKSTEVLYHLSFIRPGKMDITTAWIDFNKNELRICGDYIMVRFKCDSLICAEEIIDMLLEPNGLEVAPINLII